ncbi:MAG: FkbM family methyltransferase [Bacteroidetes bacterium]|uniref:FkbM family methyltransferase n=1 Tax=Phnomibacter sp. TaxID=2836217 RepID=UPI002FDD54C3|nr:FkbM family methyltransferase [Bacteroidota bacterium]
MSINSRQKYKELIKQVRNWPRYFTFKFLGKGKEAVFTLKKSGANIVVPYSMLRVFKEVFMQDGYHHDFVAKHLKPATTVLDIGANIGMFSAWVANHFPERTIIAFEPLAGNIAILQKNLLPPQSSLKQVSVVDKVVTGKQVPSVTFYFNKDKSESDSASVIAGFYDNHDGIEIPAISLTEIIDNCATQIGLLKMDCEGSEYDILYNSPARIFSRVDTMIIETHDIDDDRNNLQGVCDFIESIGFSYTTEHVDKGLNLVWAINNTVFPG